MAHEDPHRANSKETDQKLREALRECRELRKRTEDLLDRARHFGGPHS
jgi:hypothetical protein